MKDKYNLIAVIIFFVLLMGLSCERPDNKESLPPPKEEHINITIEEEDVVEPEEEKEEEEEIKDYRVPIDYDVEDEVLPEGYN